MAYEEGLRSISLQVDSSLASATGVDGIGASPNKGKQYRFVKIVTSGTVGLSVDDESKLNIGVLQNKPQVTGAAATVGIRGVSLVESGAAITAGVLVTTDGDGQAIPMVDGSSVALGVALEAASDAGELISVLLRVN